ncbi:MAG: hypothetical protein AAF726_10045 [Planctomycetota bacterium]
MHEVSPKTRPTERSIRLPGGRSSAAVSLVLGSLVAACGGTSSEPGVAGSGAQLSLQEVGNGFGQLLPHRVPDLDGSGQITSIRSLDDIVENVRRQNPILPSATFIETAILPDGTPGNHYIYANFTQQINALSVLSLSPSSTGLSGALSVTTIDPLSGATLPARGRAFVGGRTVDRDGSQVVLKQWVSVGANGDLVPASDVDQAVGFPGVGSSLPNEATLVSPNTIIFVADSDNDLRTFETFPEGVQIRFRVTTALRATNGRSLTDQVFASSTVGLDTLPPEVITTPPPTDAPLISPGNGDIGVDPRTSIRIEFTEPVQPYSVGRIGGTGEPTISSAIGISFGPETSVTTMPFTTLPISPFDLSVYDMTPGFSFPGQGPEFQACGTFSRVDIALTTQQIEDLAQVTTPNGLGPNINQRAASTSFETGEGPGLVNAPVAPDAIYVGRGGATPGLSVLDLNGFGQSTGNPISSLPFPLEGESRFPFDPNVTQNPTIRPLLNPGDCTIDGGSAGVFTLTLDSSLQDLVIASPLISQVTDLHIGRALDTTFRNAPDPQGCQAQGGDLCAQDGFKIIAAVTGNQPNTVAPAQVNQFGGIAPGYENIISWAPHPNPPTIAFPPLCVEPFLASNEPTTIATATPSLLVSGNPFPVPSQNRPPGGLLTLEQNQFFLGPSFGQTIVGACLPYQIRQQIGHYLYVADRPRSEIVVLNSNRMTVLERIPVADPTSLAMGPNTDLLAVTSQLADTVSFIVINPQSAQFHQVIRTVQVGNSPRGIAFEPTNEDILVCNELDSTVSVIAASNLAVRRTLGSQLQRPFELCVTPRMTNFSFLRGVYFAHILNRTGSVALMESGPNGVNGWGFDDIVGIIPFSFQAPKTVQIDPINLDASVYIVHEGPIDVGTGVPGDIGVGAISRLRLESGLPGQLPLQINGLLQPNFRDVEFSVPLSLSQANDQLSGIPIDIAFDNQRNIGGIPGPANQFSAGSVIPANNKCNWRGVPGIPVGQNTSEPRFLFASVPNPVGGNGVIDVLELGATGTPRFDTNPYDDGIQSIEVPQVTILADYWRQ